MTARRFTRQDLVTFGIGLGVALAFTLGQGLMSLDSGPVEDWSLWARNLGLGIAGAGGRYIVTALTERGLVGDDEPEPTAIEERLDALNILRPSESRSVIKP